MKNRYVFGLMGIMVIVFGVVIISAVETLGTFQQNKIIDLLQVCDNCTYVNLSSVMYPNGTKHNFNMEMTDTNNVYNFTFPNTTGIGDYFYTTCGDLNGVETCESVSFEITPSGNKLTTAEGIIYIIFIVGLTMTFLLFLYGSFVIPFGARRDDYGKIVSVNDVKYFKVVCIVFSYLTLMSLFAVMRQISANYLFLSGVHKIFQWLFWFMLSFTFPTIIVSVILTLVMFFEDKKIKEALERGVPIR